MFVKNLLKNPSQMDLESDQDQFQVVLDHSSKYLPNLVN